MNKTQESWKCMGIFDFLVYFYYTKCNEFRETFLHKHGLFDFLDYISTA